MREIKVLLENLLHGTKLITILNIYNFSFMFKLLLKCTLKSIPLTSMTGSLTKNHYLRKMEQWYNAARCSEEILGIWSLGTLIDRQTVVLIICRILRMIGMVSENCGSHLQYSQFPFWNLTMAINLNE